jgi:hypothetical protein
LWKIHIFFLADILELLAPTSIDDIFSSSINTEPFA